MWDRAGWPLSRSPRWQAPGRPHHFQTQPDGTHVQPGRCQGDCKDPNLLRKLLKPSASRQTSGH